MRTYDNEEKAHAAMRHANACDPNRSNPTVLVDGPGDDEVTLMSMARAIENELYYSVEF